MNHWITPSKREIRFLSGLYVEVFWHVGLKMWAAEAYTYREDRVSEYLGTSLDVYTQERPGTRKSAVQRLRRAIAEKKDPRVAKAIKRMKPESILTPITDEQMEKMMNLGRHYNAGPRKINDFRKIISP